MIAALVAAFLFSQWQQLNSERTADRPEPPPPEPFDPFEVPEGESIFFPGLQFFTGTRTSSTGDTGSGGGSTSTSTEELAAAGLRWGPVFPVVPVGDGASGGGSTRNLLLLAGNGMVIGNLGFANWSVTSTSPTTGQSITVFDQTSWTLGGANGAIQLPGESAGPAPSPARQLNRARSGTAGGGASPIQAPAATPTRAPQLPPATAPAPTPATVPPTLPAGVPLPPAVPLLPQAPVIPANGQQLAPSGQPTPTPTPAPQLTPPGTTFLPPGVPLPPNGPPPTMQGISNELGKIEKKIELALAPDGPLSLLDKINRVIDQIENIKFVLDALFPPGPYTFGPGAYQLQPVCEKDANGDPLPPLVAEWPGGEGEIVEVLQRIDAIAQVLQFQKDTKQPTCGGRGNGPGSNVTVHFESDL